MAIDEKLLLAEQEKLRTELQGLKECQVRYFWSAITATGVIFGLGGKLGLSSGTPIHLSPLVILLPTWLIFFDKATTITRIVGYSRILEYELAKPQKSAHHYIGWENALALLRKRQQEKQKTETRKRTDILKEILNDARKGAKRVLDLRSTHQYWNINWLTFCSLSVLCVVLGFRTFYWPVFVVIVITVLVTIARTLELLFHLTDEHGRYTYNKNCEVWKELLSGNDAKNYFSHTYEQSGPTSEEEPVGSDPPPEPQGSEDTT